MPVLDVLHYPDERLKQVSRPVTAFDVALARFIADLDETMRAFPGCVGLAAAQVDRFQRIAIVDVSSKPKIAHNGRLILINPVIVSAQGRVIGREGCLSVPDYTGNVERAQQIEVESHDVDGRQRRYVCEGYEARAVLHEIDHLDGLLFLDRVVGARDLFRRKAYK
jgi:peptide deformylase